MVTGAASGIGKAVVQRLVREGVDVLAVDIDARRLEETAEEGCRTLVANVGDPAERLRVAAAAEDVDYLVNAAGIIRIKPIFDVTVEDWRDVFAVNITQTLGSGYGSGVVIGDTGIAMNNGHHWCTLIPGHPKEIAPDKRRESPSSPVHGFGLHEGPPAPTHSFGIDPLGPAHAARDGRLDFMIGTPGSYGIPQTTAQMIINLIDFQRNIQDAIAAPRFRWKDDVGDPLPPKVLLVEGRFAPSTLKALAARGYKIERIEDWSMKVGGGQGIAFREDGWMMGGADPRRNGYAMGW